MMALKLWVLIHSLTTSFIHSRMHLGSEGYLINQFIAQHTNKRTDEWGGSYENRIKLPIEIVKGVRKACGPEFIIIYRLSMLDLVNNGSSFDEVVTLAKHVEAAGASIINTGHSLTHPYSLTHSLTHSLRYWLA